MSKRARPGGGGSADRAPLGARDQPYDVRVRDLKDDIMRPLVVRMLRNAPKTWWSILNYWGFGPESYASESDKRKWEMASYVLDLTDADATAALRDLLGEIATDRGGVWFLNDDLLSPPPQRPKVEARSVVPAGNRGSIMSGFTDMVSAAASMLGFKPYEISGGKKIASGECLTSAANLALLSLAPDTRGYSENAGLNLTERLRYAGRPVTLSYVGGGSFGAVYEARTRDGHTLAVKLFNDSISAGPSMELAAQLRKCDLISFRMMHAEPAFAGRSFTTDKGDEFHFNRILFMDKLDGDCAELRNLMYGTSEFSSFEMPISKKTAYCRAFVAFLAELYRCLEAHGATFTDMKLENVGFCNQNALCFRLIDLDGLASRQYTYPLADGTDVDPTRQTAYAFAVTARLFCSRDEDAANYYNVAPFSYADRAEHLRTASKGQPDADFVEGMFRIFDAR